MIWTDLKSVPPGEPGAFVGPDPQNPRRSGVLGRRRFLGEARPIGPSSAPPRRPLAPRATSAPGPRSGLAARRTAGGRRGVAEEVVVLLLLRTGRRIGVNPPGNLGDGRLAATAWSAWPLAGVGCGRPSWTRLPDQPALAQEAARVVEPRRSSLSLLFLDEAILELAVLRLDLGEFAACSPVPRTPGG